MTETKKVFVKELAAELSLPEADIEKALRGMIYFLEFRKEIAGLLTKSNPEPEPKDNTIRIHVQDTIKTVDKVGEP